MHGPYAAEVGFRVTCETGVSLWLVIPIPNVDIFPVRGGGDCLGWDVPLSEEREGEGNRRIKVAVTITRITVTRKTIYLVRKTILIFLHKDLVAETGSSPLYERET